jgi:hypothetical protein
MASLSRRLLRRPVVQGAKHLHYRAAARFSSEPLPNFFIVGAAHSGSTSMYSYVKQHPAVFMSERKEPNFFRTRLPGVGWVGRYLELFEAAQEHHHVVGEASPWYLYDANVARRISRCHGDAKIAVILRDPVERAVSQFQYVLRRRGTWPADALDQFRAHVHREIGLEHTATGGSGHELRAGLYCEQLQRYVDRFPAEQIHVCLTEDLLRSPETVMRGLFRFLGVDESFRAETTERHNAAPTGERIELPDELRRELRRYFAPDVEKLGELLGRDLSGWTD